MRGRQANLVESSFLDNIIRLDDAYYRMFNRVALNAEARILFILSKQGAMSVKDAMHNSRLSQRAFYLTLDRMKKLGMVVARQDEGDARFRHIYLDQKFKSQLVEIFSRSFKNIGAPCGTCGDL